MPPIPHVSVAINIFKSKSPQCYAAAIATYILAVGALALRFWARRLKKAKISVDDWTAAAALLLATGSLILTIAWLHQGLGQHFEIIGQDIATTFGKNFFAGEILYCVTIGIVKISILAFYWRLFITSNRTTSNRIPCYVLGAVTVCWEIAVILGTIFQCVPVPGFWNPMVRTKCFSYKHFLLGNAIPNILTDVALLLLPVNYIWNLHTTTVQKVELAGIFMLGGIVTVISIVRLTILLKLDLHSSDLDYNFVTFVGWSIAESNMAIVAACLPSLRPILVLIPYGPPDPSIRSARSPACSPAWPRSPPWASTQNHGQPLTGSASKSQKNFARLSDEAYGFQGIKPLRATAKANSAAESKRWDGWEIDTRTAGRVGSGIMVKTDVIVHSTSEKLALRE